MTRKPKRTFRPDVAEAICERRELLSAGLEISGGSAGPRTLRADIAAAQATAVSPGERFRMAISQEFSVFETEILGLIDSFVASGRETNTRAILEVAATQRVFGLSQDLANLLSRIPGATKRSHGNPPPLQTFLQRRILSTQGNSGLLGAVRASLPPALATGAAAESPQSLEIYRQAVAEAVNAAEKATFNALAFARGKTFFKSH